MKTRFDDMDFATAQKAYRAAMMQAHPDHGGTVEEAQALNEEWYAYTAHTINGAFTAAENQKAGSTKGYSATIFADKLRDIVKFDISIEIIGYWIYAFRSFEYHDQLKAMGFWFSMKHKAWIYSGGKKKPIRRTHTTAENRAKWGTQTVENEFTESAVSA